MHVCHGGTWLYSYSYVLSDITKRKDPCAWKFHVCGKMAKNKGNENKNIQMITSSLLHVICISRKQICINKEQAKHVFCDSNLEIKRMYVHNVWKRMSCIWTLTKQ